MHSGDDGKQGRWPYFSGVLLPDLPNRVNINAARSVKNQRCSCVHVACAGADAALIFGVLRKCRDFVSDRASESSLFR
jgi:hypothetical protein